MVSSWTSSDQGSATADLLAATTLIVLHDQVGIARPTAATMTRLVAATRARADQLGASPAAMNQALAETMTQQMNAAVPPPTGPIPAGMIDEEVARWIDPAHPATRLIEDPDQIPDWLPTQYLPG